VRIVNPAALAENGFWSNDRNYIAGWIRSPCFFIGTVNKRELETKNKEKGLSVRRLNPFLKAERMLK